MSPIISEMQDNNAKLQNFVAQDIIHKIKSKLRARAGSLDKLAFSFKVIDADGSG
jgi:hypothetical protein